MDQISRRAVVILCVAPIPFGRPLDRAVVVIRKTNVSNGWLLSLPSGRANEGEDLSVVAAQVLERETRVRVKPDAFQQACSRYRPLGIYSHTSFLYFCEIRNDQLPRSGMRIREESLEVFVRDLGQLLSGTEFLRLHRDMVLSAST